MRITSMFLWTIFLAAVISHRVNLANIVPPVEPGNPDLKFERPYPIWTNCYQLFGLGRVVPCLRLLCLNGYRLFQLWIPCVTDQGQTNQNQSAKRVNEGIQALLTSPIAITKNTGSEQGRQTNAGSLERRHKREPCESRQTGGPSNRFSICEESP